MDIIEELKKLNQLLDDGIVSEEEYNDLKNEILGIIKQSHTDSEDLTNENVSAKIDEEAEKTFIKNNEKSIEKEEPNKVKFDNDLKCKKCGVEISKDLNESNKGLCISCKKKKTKIPKILYLIPLLLIPLVWWFVNSLNDEQQMDVIEPKPQENKKVEIRSTEKLKFVEPINLDAIPILTGFINDTDVIIRDSYTPSSKIIGLFNNLGESVEIIDIYALSNNSEALLSKDINVNLNNKITIIEKGKALHIISENNGTYLVSFKDKELQEHHLSLESDAIEQAYTAWYKVKSSRGEVGWVLGKFINLNDGLVKEAEDNLNDNIIKRNPNSWGADHDNIFWKRAYTLFDFSTGEPIFPELVNGELIYKIYYSSNEDPKPYYGEFSIDKLEQLYFYKFKNKENCLVFCESKNKKK
ncbi:SHOCT domain-containing protein [Yeosuana sp.]|uniref:SHOCT domain-containing protein n=1 Tax=Yeosuana sp. TaxID=2529388 RepID=UPI004054CC3B|tara:strand:+ start:4240 stop:5475 length:1236 start_codon:yes stop_codon:yes gene_type:complete